MCCSVLQCVAVCCSVLQCVETEVLDLLDFGGAVFSVETVMQGGEDP